jgi:hypothetical protein
VALRDGAFLTQLFPALVRQLEFLFARFAHDIALK